ncbi:MAG: asparagine synthase (glutamine-hydrolyzing) [Acidobacteria bacterium]|nr:asparagine synthase (glutamine-hydrolyzing) [Acidobacteriota bacterium]
MCGIIGIVSNRSHAEIYEAITRGTRSLAHRGPDDEGIEFLTKESDPMTVAFGHRRLSILDLSPAGHQPMRDAATGNWITFNGEVFNFRDLRPSLEQQQIKFHSESDTEVLLKGLGLRGLDAVKDWRGMFALGQWEPANRRLTLIRDRLGIKPLYYYYDGQTFLFASEVRALLKTGLVPRKLSRAAVESYLTYGSVQQPLTIIENVYSVLPGHWLRFERGEIKSQPYWELQAKNNTPSKSEPELVEEISDLLLGAVRLRMIADVPVGAFLSGGIDSSAIVSLMRRVTTGTIRTFSVYFNEKEFSEHAFAEEAARYFETDHHPVLVTENDILAKLPRALAAMDQPSQDGINSYIVSEATAQSGLKVALSGLGGDEVFAGYPYFRTIARDERLRKKVSKVPLAFRRAASSAISAVANSNRATKLAGILRSNELDTHSLFLHRQLFTEAQRKQLLTDNGYAKEQWTRDWQMHGEWETQRFLACSDDDPINQASCFDLSGYLSDTLLRDTDAMSMAHSLEVRVPLIDHHVVERLATIPGNVKLRPDAPKWLLVKAVGDLPATLVDRPKRGFEFPFKKWLLGALREEAREALSSSNLQSLLQLGVQQALWERFEDGRISWTRVWSLWVLSKYIGEIEAL